MSILLPVPVLLFVPVLLPVPVLLFVPEPVLLLPVPVLLLPVPVPVPAPVADLPEDAVPVEPATDPDRWLLMLAPEPELLLAPVAPFVPAFPEAALLRGVPLLEAPPTVEVTATGLAVPVGLVGLDVVESDDAAGDVVTAADGDGEGLTVADGDGEGVGVPVADGADTGVGVVAAAVKWTLMLTEHVRALPPELPLPLH